jgi:hypothetical protein
MKIHMDYLEGKVEEYENMRLRWDAERKNFAIKVQAEEEKWKKQIEAEVKKVRDECRGQIEAAERKWKDIEENQKTQREATA